MSFACRRLLFACAALLAGSVLAPVADAGSGLQVEVTEKPADTAARLALGRAWLERGHAGERQAPEEALACFDDVLQASPGHALARALRGEAFLLLAREAAMDERLSLARRGFAEMDAAVAAAPGDPEVRLVRATNGSRAPRMLERGETARADFVVLVALADREDGTLSRDQRRMILFRAGAFALRDRRAEAIPLLERALAVPGTSPPDDQLQSMLALAREEFTPHGHADGEAQASSPSP